MIVRDHYFAAWAAVRGTPHKILPGEFHLLISLSECKKLREEYGKTAKKEFDLIKKFTRLARIRSLSQLPD